MIDNDNGGWSKKHYSFRHSYPSILAEKEIEEMYQGKKERKYDILTYNHFYALLNREFIF